MRKLILMTSAAVLMPFSSWGEDIICTLTKDCTELGYNSSVSCDNGVKCPWGEAWYCPPSPPEVCEIGSILYSDMTCSAEVKTGKTPIGVVVYVDGTGAGQALALKSLDTNYTWTSEYVDISGLKNYASSSEASTDYASCENSKIIMAAGDKSKYPAVWAANEYKTEGTSAGDWCLPSAGIFTSYYNNQTAINTGFERANGTKFSKTMPYTNAWSSSEQDSSSAWYSSFIYAYGLSSFYSYGSKTSSMEVRPVFEFEQTFEGVCPASYSYVCGKVNYDKINYADGVGESCGGKYKECACDEGFIWTGSDCKRLCEAGSELGYILYSDMTRSAELDSTKTPIGVVVCSYRDGGGQAMALDSIGSSYIWGGYGVDILTLPNLSAALASINYASCENSKMIMAAGDKDTYPAVWAAHEYSTEGTNAGDWCLPAASIFTAYYNNQDIINSGFAKAGGTSFASGVWSSSEEDKYSAWTVSFTYKYGLFSVYNKEYKYKVRPVIEF